MQNPENFRAARAVNIQRHFPYLLHTNIGQMIVFLGVFTRRPDNLGCFSPEGRTFWSSIKKKTPCRGKSKKNTGLEYILGTATVSPPEAIFRRNSLNPNNPRFFVRMLGA